MIIITRVHSMQKKEAAQRASCCTHDLIHRLKGRSPQEAETGALKTDADRQLALEGREVTVGRARQRPNSEQQCSTSQECRGSGWAGGGQALGIWSIRAQGETEKANVKRMKNQSFPPAPDSFLTPQLIIFRVLSIQNYRFWRMPVGNLVVCGCWVD